MNDAVMLKLDVGCGSKPTGNVNVDLYLEPTTHRGPNAKRLTADLIPNLICADMKALPFKDGAFNHVYSNQTIEHTKGAFKAMHEMTRVSSDIVEVICPHRFMRALLSAYRWKVTHHVSHLTKRWFMAVAKILQLRVVRCEYTKFENFPHLFIPILNLPRRIHFVASKTHFKGRK